MKNTPNENASIHETADTPLIVTRDLSVYYRAVQALNSVSLDVPERLVTAFIGPSGCGKSTLLRSFNRMNEMIDQVKTTGEVSIAGHDIYAPSIDVVQLRKKVGMVFQKSNPFPKTIRENIVYALRLHGTRDRAQLNQVVESSLRSAALWDEVKDRLDTSALSLSGGQQQRLTIARALSHEPEVLCLDEFSIAIDPVTTMRIEDVLKELQSEMTIILVTNLVQQARRLAKKTAFIFNGELVELDETEKIFSGEATDSRTNDFVSGIFG